MENKIKMITRQDGKVLKVGWHGVEEIKDASLEFEKSIHIKFDAYGNDGKLLGTFIGGDLAIIYF